MGEAIWDLVFHDLEVYSDPISLLVLKDARERDEGGTKKYGTRLGCFDGRDSLIDPYQEALDVVVYLRKVLEEYKREHKGIKDVRDLYFNATQLAIGIRRLIFKRDGH